MMEVKEKVELQRYSEYKDSGLDWLGEIPKDWQLIRANYVFDIIDERSKTGKEELLSVSEHHGVKKRSESTVNMFMAESYKGYKLCYPGDLVINSLWAWSRGLGFSSLKGIVSTAYSVFRPDHENYDHKYLHYLLRTRKYVAQYLIASKGIWISRLQLSDWAFLRISILSPPKEEQTAIAHFLDRKTEQIDQAIEIKQKQIELLKERRQILIHKAVTRGLNPDASLKPSGVDWIGDIPEHWEVKKLFGLCRFVRGNSSFSKDELLSNGKYVALQYGKSYQVDEINEEFEFYVNDEFYKDSQVVSLGDTILISTSETIEDLGHSVYYNRRNLGLLGGEQMLLSSLSDEINSRYLYYSSKVFSKSLRKYATGIKVFRFNINDLKTIYVPVPPTNEQILIEEFIELNTNKIGKAISFQKDQIEELKEYKTTLINSAVTGKIKVS